jgi:hypothetical protein
MMAGIDLGRLSAGAVTAVLLLSGVATAAPTPNPSNRPAPSGVSITPLPTSPHLTGQGQALDFRSVNPGATVSDQVLLRNIGDTAVPVQLYPADATTAVGGGLAFGLRSAHAREIGAWTTLSRTSVTVPPHGSIPLSLRITVPTVVQGGGYAGGIVAEQVSPPATQGGLAQIFRFAMPVYLKVPGGAPGATPGRGSPDGTIEVVDVAFPVRGGKVCPVLTYRNSSQDVVNPDARVVVDPRWIGSKKAAVYKGIGTLVPDTSATKQLPCRALPPTGGSVEVDLVGPHVSPLKDRRSTDVDGSPWAVILALLLLLLLLGLFLLLLFKRRSRDDEEEEAAAQAG